MFGVGGGVVGMEGEALEELVEEGVEEGGVEACGGASVEEEGARLPGAGAPESSDVVEVSGELLG